MKKLFYILISIGIFSTLYALIYMSIHGSKFGFSLLFIIGLSALIGLLISKR